MAQQCKVSIAIMVFVLVFREPIAWKLLNIELPVSVFLAPSSSGQAHGKVPPCLHLSCALKLLACHLAKGTLSFLRVYA